MIDVEGRYSDKVAKIRATAITDNIMAHLPKDIKERPAIIELIPKIN